MSKAWKRFLSLLLAATMVLSLGVTGFALDETDDAANPGEENEPSIVLVPDTAEETDGDSTQLEMVDISPDKLNVPKLGLEEAEEDEEPGSIVPMDDEEEQDAIVRVSIFLDEPSTIAAGFSGETAGYDAAAIAYRDSLRAQHEAMKAQIASAIGHELDVEWDLTLAVNAISANVSTLEIVKIEQIPGVRSVQRENQYLPMTGTIEPADDPNTANTSENMVGATAAWTAGYTGAGSRIAIIDTGIDTTHQSFADEPFTYSIGKLGATGELMTQTDISSVLTELNARQKLSSVTAQQLNRSGGGGSATNNKIPYGFNYVDGNLTIDHMSDTNGEHGSHVAGIAAANRYIGSAHNDAVSTVGAVGMAPDAQLLVMKVFGAKGGAYDSDYMVAIEDAMLLGADAANLSLGSAVQGWTFDNDYQDLILGWANGEHNDKMVLTISAGNSYDLAYMMSNKDLYIEDVDMHTGGSPGTFLNSLCVAAAQNTITKGTPMEFNGSQDVYYYESTGNEEEGTTYTNPALTTIVGTYNYVYIDATGSASDYSTINSAVSLSGKVVIVNRGELSFVEKGENAKSYSPKALIVANNQDGTIYMDLSDFTGTFPMVTITLKDAQQIKDGATAHTANGITYYTGSMKVTNTEKEVVIDRSEATITEFSSWGVPGSLIMKPEITAPGGDIYSVAGTNKTSSGTAGGSDQYENMSGTSMAAPHMAGLTGVLAEYLRENDLKAKNDGLASFTIRAITQSLLMSTATPMQPGGEYLPILQQGAGLADVSKAVTASSVIMMDPAKSGLTGLTGAAADGKVKFEFGDDPAREGDYEFGFTIYNLTDKVLSFDMSTDVFTQDIKEGATGLLMDRGTTPIGASVTYYWAPTDGVEVAGHDVDKDGDTDNDDAQAILDYLTGVIEDPDTLDLDAGDLDGDGEATSYDAYLLLGLEPEESGSLPNGQVPAGGSRYVSVRIQLTDKAYLDNNYPGGAYIQAFTYAKCTTSDREGVDYRHTHSIPVLGFYGSWTDATMFDTTSYVEKLYGSQQVSYTGNDPTNYITMQMNGTNVKFSGNPYKVEESGFPADRLAINSSTTILNIAYNLVRAAGTTGFAVTKLDAEGNVTDVVSSSIVGNDVTGIYYSSSAGWQGLTQKLYGVNKAPSGYGLSAGERFRIGFYAIPEYNAMVVNNDYTSANAGKLGQAGFNTLLKSNVLGKGAFVGYDFVIDNEEPKVDDATLNGSQLTVSATDNEALAYVAVLSLDGETVYAEATPGENSYSVTFDASDAIANARGYVAVFAGDYAGNETAKAVKVNNNTYEEKTVYVLTSNLTAGNDYLIVSRNNAGAGYALGHSGSTVATNAVTVKAGTSETNNVVYIDSMDVASTSVWTASSGIKLQNGNYYIRRNNGTTGTTLQVSTTNSNNSWTYSNNRLYQTYNSRSYYVRYYNNNFTSMTTTATNIYVYQKTTIRTEIDPYGVTSVTVTPSTLDLYKGNTADLTAKVLPLTAADRTVTWSSSNNSVATVDAFGKVTAVAAGTATITATSNGDDTKSASCTVTVTAVNKTLNAIIWDEEGEVFFSSFNANNLPTWTKLNNNAVGTYLTSAFQNTTSALYAGTLDTSDISTTIYTVNSSTYALTEYGQNYVGAFGMARASSQYTGYFVYGFAKYLIFGNLAPQEDDDGTFSGLPYGLLDLSTTNVGDAYVCGICARSIGTTSSSFYFLDETGKIWQTTMTIGSSVSFGTPTLVVDTGIGTSFLYQSLYYDGAYIYWSHQTDNEAELIIVNASTKKVYHAGNFGEGVWPAAGLFVKGSVAPASVGDEIMGEELELQRVAGYNDLLTADVRERLTDALANYGVEPAFRLPLDEIDEPGLGEDELPVLTPADDPDAGEDEDELPVLAPADEPEENKDEDELPILAPVDEPDEGEIGVIGPVNPAPVGDEDQSLLGHLTSLRIPNVHFAAPAIVTIDPNAIGGDFNEEEGAYEVTIPIAEDVDSHNGLIAFAYDTETITYVNYTPNADITLLSVFEDTDKGIITIAYANKGMGGDDELPIASVRGGATDEIDAETPIVELNFIIDCEKSLAEVMTLQRNDDVELSESSDVNIFGAGHIWSLTGWTWADDYSTATASFTCEHCGETIVEDADVTVETLDATCEAEGKTTYTATVELEDVTYTDVKEETIEALGHDWGEPTWTWAEDHSTATATFTCLNDASHIQTVEATVTSAEGTGDDALDTVYTATAQFEGETYTDIQKVAIIAYYLVGVNGNWTPDAAFRFEQNASNDSEYILNTELTVGTELKVVRAEGTNITNWYPDSNENGNYTVDYAHSGVVNVYFRPTANGDWYGFHAPGYFYIEKLHTVTVTTDGNGTASIDPAAPGYTATVTLTATPDDGYVYDYTEIYKKTGEGENDKEQVELGALQWNDDSKTFVMPDFDIIIVVYFKQDAHDHVDADGDLFCDICNERMGVLVTATSAAGTLDGPTVTFVQGGAKLYFGQSTTLIAGNVNGYAFDGWYLNGTKVSEELSYTYTAPEGATEDARFVALYIGTGTFRLTVTGSKFTISGLAATQRTYFNDLYAANAQLTVTFLGSEDETFLYWINDNGKILSTSPTYSFYMVAHTTIHAVSSDADTSKSEALVVFVNNRTNGQVLASHYYSVDDTITFPSAPSSMGREFAGWSLTEEEIKAKMATESKIVVYATFAASSETYLVTVKNNINDDEVVSNPISSGLQYTVKADTTLGTFSYWMLNDKIVSYNPTIVVRSTMDLTLTAVYNEAVEPVPVITMTEAYGAPNGEKYAMTFVAMRGVPEGWTVQRQGILYTTRTDLDGKDLKEIIVLDGDGIRAYNSDDTDLNGVLALTVNAKNAAHVHARGYMIVMKDGVATTYYSDEILDLSYTP